MKDNPVQPSEGTKRNVPVAVCLLVLKKTMGSTSSAKIDGQNHSYLPIHYAYVNHCDANELPIPKMYEGENKSCFEIPVKTNRYWHKLSATVETV